ncbi:mitosis inhibitor protein kinase swe1 [Basidiobolus ranarum]|uniref:Mitosis inhibitor protein kinase swe1 n=1 Tax=Basidiobolus ranarum TaxID=34480 RepID=A0ABR2WZ91_9FUNG
MTPKKPQSKQSSNLNVNRDFEFATPMAPPSRTSRRRSSVRSTQSDDVMFTHGYRGRSPSISSLEADTLTPESIQSTKSLFTPNTNLVKPLASAFMSTGLLSKKNRPRSNTSRSNAPDTPSKRSPLSFNSPRVLPTPKIITDPVHVFHSEPVRPKRTTSPLPEHLQKQKKLNLSYSPPESPTNFSSVMSNMLKSTPRASHTKLFQSFLDAGDEDEQEVDFPVDSKLTPDPSTPTHVTRILDPEDSPFFENSLDQSAEHIKSSPMVNFITDKDDMMVCDDEEDSHVVPYQSPIAGHNLVLSNSQTIFPHLLDCSYFVQLHSEGGQHFLLPELANKVYTDNYFEKKFHVCEKIGSGEFSDVYKVQELATSKFYAIKKNKYQFQGPRDRTRQLEEVEILWKVKHRGHCVQIENAWEQHGYLYIQLELCEYGSLYDFMDEYCQHESLEEKYIWHIITQICFGLKNIHDLGILHLDLKPANVFISEYCTVKVGDFGLAIVEPLPRDVEREGDREYLAPEIFEGKYGKFADIFSLGLIVLEMAANVVLPDNGEAWQKLRSADLSDCDLEHVSSSLVELILRMIDPDPLKRPTVDMILSHPNIQSITRSFQEHGANALYDLFTESDEMS